MSVISPINLAAPGAVQPRVTNPQPASPAAVPADTVDIQFAGKGKILKDYYKTPTHDFTQFTIDYEENHWTKDRFPWHQDVKQNLATRLDGLATEELTRTANLALPLVNDFLAQRHEEITKNGLPMDADGLRILQASLTSANAANLNQAISIQAPLETVNRNVEALEEKLEIQHQELEALKEQKKLRLFKSGPAVKQLETDAEKQIQAGEINATHARIKQLEGELKTASRSAQAARKQLEPQVKKELQTLQAGVLQDIENTRSLIQQTLETGLPADATQLAQVKELIVNRQFRGLQDIANHALVAEQAAIAPLTTGIIRYKNKPEIQEAMTTFVADEAKHSGVFRRYQTDKMNAKASVLAGMVQGGDRFMIIGKTMPSAAVFLAIVVETVGGAFFEYFGKHAPDPLFREICETIAEKDEKRHMNLCTTLYNEEYRKNTKWEEFRNRQTFKVIMKELYGDRNTEHYLLQACTSFGLDPQELYKHIAKRLNEEFAKIGFDAQADKLIAELQNK